MLEATITSKGQTTIPKNIRDALGIEAGDRITFTLMPDGTVILRAKTRNLAEMAGALSGQTTPGIEARDMSPWQ